MSNPPPVQYMAPQYSHYPPARGGPARRAAVIMWVLGGMVTFYFCFVFASLMAVTPEQYHQQIQVLAQHGFPTNDPSFSESAARTSGKVFAAIGVVFGITVLCLAFGVRRGRRAPTWVAVVLTGGVGALLALFVLGSVIAGVMVPVLFVAAFLFALMLVPVVFLMIWLIQSLRVQAYGPLATVPMQMTPMTGRPAWAGYPPRAAVPAAPPMPQSTLGYAYPGLTPPPRPPAEQPVAAPMPPGDSASAGS